MSLTPEFTNVIPETRVHIGKELLRIAPFRIKLFCWSSTVHVSRGHALSDEIVEASPQRFDHVRQFLQICLCLYRTASRNDLRLCVRQLDERLIRLCHPTDPASRRP